MIAWIEKGVRDARRILKETPVSTTVVFVLFPAFLAGIILYTVSCCFH